MQEPMREAQTVATKGGIPTGAESTARAVWRLAKFFGVTVARLCVAVPAVTLSRTPGPTAARQAHGWGRSLAKHFGVEVLTDTPLPAGSAIIVANHRSYIDACAVLSELSASFTGKAELTRWPFIGFTARIGGTIFVARDSLEGRNRSREALRRRLEEGVCMVVFPEGTSTAGPGLLPFRPGIFRLAAEGGFPVVPAAIWYEERDAAFIGDDTFLGHFLRVFRKKAIHVHIAYGPRMTGEDPEVLRSQTWAWIAENLKS